MKAKLATHVQPKCKNVVLEWFIAEVNSSSVGHSMFAIAIAIEAQALALPMQIGPAYS